MTEHRSADQHAADLKMPNHEHGDFWASTEVTNEVYDSAPNHGTCACGRYAVADGIHWHLRGKCHTRELCDE